MAPSASELRELLPSRSMVFGATALSRDDAIAQSGALLVAAGRVDGDYVRQMLDRERVVSTFVGDGIAMPHGTLSTGNEVIADGLSLLVLESPIDWGGSPVSLVIGIAAHGRRYITLLSQLARALLTAGRSDSLRLATSAERVYELLED